MLREDMKIKHQQSILREEGNILRKKNVIFISDFWLD